MLKVWRFGCKVILNENITFLTVGSFISSATGLVPLGHFVSVQTSLRWSTPAVSDIVTYPGAECLEEPAHRVQGDVRDVASVAAVAGDQAQVFRSVNPVSCVARPECRLQDEGLIFKSNEAPGKTEDRCGCLQSHLTEWDARQQLMPQTSTSTKQQQFTCVTNIAFTGKQG